MGKIHGLRESTLVARLAHNMREQIAKKRQMLEAAREDIRKLRGKRQRQEEYGDVEYTRRFGMDDVGPKGLGRVRAGAPLNPESETEDWSPWDVARKATGKRVTVAKPGVSAVRPRAEAEDMGHPEMRKNIGKHPAFLKHKGKVHLQGEGAAGAGTLPPDKLRQRQSGGGSAGDAPHPGMLEKERQFDPNVGGGVDRDKVPSKDFAGRKRSFPIVSPEDVSHAAKSIGRARNQDPAKIKRNIKSIAKRKGPAFVKRLPKSYKDNGFEEQGDDFSGSTAVDHTATVGQKEVSPPGWSGTTKAMKAHPKISNPWALAWWMKGKGDKPHYPPEKKKKGEREANTSSGLAQLTRYRAEALPNLQNPADRMATLALQRRQRAGTGAALGIFNARR